MPTTPSKHGWQSTVGENDRTGRPSYPRPKTTENLVAWIAISVTLVLTLLSWVYVGGVLSAEVAQNTKTLDKLPLIIVPRREVEAKLESIETQVEVVDEKVEELKVQSVRQTEQILRQIERLSNSGRVIPQ